MGADRLKSILDDFRHGLERIYGSRLIRVVLFGSQARCDAAPDSDIDLMLVLKGPVDPRLEINRLAPFSSALSLQYDALISCVYLSQEDFENRQSPLMLNVRREGVPV